MPEEVNGNGLEKELQTRGTAEVSNGVVNQITQAIDERGDSVKFLMFGELREQEITPIEKACAQCDHRYFKTIRQCQERQRKDALARGFTKVICPQQFTEDK